MRAVTLRDLDEMMKDLAPRITRQRLLIEGIYERSVGRATVLEYFDKLLAGLDMTAAGEPIVNSSVSKGKAENQGIEAFIPLIGSGIALYTWESSRFLSLIVYTCKAYDNDTALAITQEFFELSEMAYKEF
jgi:S-adenosylmethionine/arginine decarboxylase-like enzyme